ncbi:CHAP domain-containing protein [Streptomyces sp. NPDC001634]|uniref:CHAP domain-containing protein n=1 Tax=Streptomyces sp. NPDC001634 TaxID=3154390 RepID=UPI0033215816
MHWRTSKKSLRVAASGATATAALAAFGATGHAAPALSPRNTSLAAVNPAACPWKGASGPRKFDGHGYYKGSCASFAAWAIRTDGRHHRRSPDFLGVAGDWTGAATSAVPHVGDIAQWDPGVHGFGSEGHVAYVVAVGHDGTVTLHEYGYRSAYNDFRPGSLSIRSTSASDPSRYLRF